MREKLGKLITIIVAIISLWAGIGIFNGLVEVAVSDRINNPEPNRLSLLPPAEKKGTSVATSYLLKLNPFLASGLICCSGLALSILIGQVIAGRDFANWFFRWLADMAAKLLTWFLLDFALAVMGMRFGSGIVSFALMVFGSYFIWLARRRGANRMA